MISIKLIKKGKGIEGFLVDINKKAHNIQGALKIIGKEAQEHMRNTIDTASEHGEGKLGKSIKVHEEGTGVGVGKISELEKYWYVLNYGMTVQGGKWTPPKNRGYWDGGGKWVHTGDRNDMLLTPKSYTKIEYIEKMKAWMDANFRSRLDALSKTK